MVLSILDNDINYIETRNVDTNDIDYETNIYTGEIFKAAISFVLGNPNFEYVEKNIVYFNIYLVSNKSVYCKIGIYEIENDKYSSCLDDEGFIQINKLYNPLIFEFTKTIILKEYKKLYKIEVEDTDDDDDDDDDDEDDDEDGDEDGEIDSSEIDSDEIDSDEIDGKKLESLKTIKPDIRFLEQTKEEAEKEYSQYIFNDTHSWVSQFFRVNKYTLHDNEGGGDCFFAVLRDALHSKKIILSISEIRNKLANEVSDEIFKQYYDLYNMFYKENKESIKEKKDAKSLFESSKIKLQTTDLLSSEKIKLFEKAKHAEKQFMKSSNMEKDTRNMLEEFKFMDGVNTIEKLRDKIKTNSFWADGWAVSTLERIYNVKFIILSKVNYLENDYDNVLQCGELDKLLQEKKIFEPQYYILSDYKQNEHYKLIKYMDRGALTFKEIPYKIKELIADKCLEKLSGSYSIIPDFIEFKTTKSKQQIEKPFIKSEEMIDNTKLYNDSIEYVIHRRAANAEPGNGSNERKDLLKLSKLEKENIVNLKKEKNNWRRMLDNDYEKENMFEIDGKVYNSITEYLKQFTDRKNLNELLILKFNSKNNPELYNVLVLTGNAKISLYTNKIGLRPLNELMEVRNILRNKLN